MNTFPEKVTSRLYRFASGQSANALRFHYEDLAGAVVALSEQTHVEPKPWTEFFPETKDSDALAALFNRYGSDKSGKHNYHVIYASLLDRNAPLNIFEIGLGTNNPHLLSTMGVNGKPGAAERAFRDWAPNANLYGADIDRDILFSEERIQTFFADQTDPANLHELGAKLPQFDLIIDDGLHTPRANMNVINFALTKLKPGGVIVIEDIIARFLPFWRIAVTVLSQSYDCQFVQMKSEAVVILKKPA
jgi:SAM-dependent methyltransferase